MKPPQHPFYRRFLQQPLSIFYVQPLSSSSAFLFPPFRKSQQETTTEIPPLVPAPPPSPLLAILAPDWAHTTHMKVTSGHHFSPLHNKETLQSTLEGLLHGVMDSRRGPIRWSPIQKTHKPESHQLLGENVRPLHKKRYCRRQFFSTLLFTFENNIFVFFFLRELMK